MMSNPYEGDDTRSPLENVGPPIDVQNWDATQASDWFYNEFVVPLERTTKALKDILTGKFLDSSIHPWSLTQLSELQHVHATAVEAAFQMKNYWEHYYREEDE